MSADRISRVVPVPGDDAGAQYFGRNKVQYDADRVLVLSTEHFDIYYSQEDAAAAALAGAAWPSAGTRG